ncbi:polysaccharide biosynthesis tyrosine autokinase [Solimonas sp. K1W22B-7]|uniref:polysaccharide biosynthesis tyrosine autokinase n=1 Tax=Solimonas sp. K1W22B-7 TaxID=2303331 RepID=UPI000E3314ED|nr:polysaccharide biosynthesis tyrosine autokinase [Solimonas sp. K1W22B-7]AXQ29917.1 polysaccharide biosynthesis tyrosine autokinase [Solimonas sp. K1W22B-7]
MSVIQDPTPITEPAFAVPQQQESSFGPKELAATLFANWMLLVFFLLAGLFLAWIYLYLAKPIYKANATVMIETKSNAMMMAYGDAGAGVMGFGQTLAEIEVMTSQLVLSRVVADMKADIVVSPRHFPVIGEALARRNSVFGTAFAQVPGLRRYVWSATELTVPTFDVPRPYLERAFTVHVVAPGKYNVLLGEKLVILEAEVGKSAAAVLDPVTGGELRVFVSDMKAPSGAHFQLRKLSTLSAIRRLKSTLDAVEDPKGSGVVEITAKDSDRPRAAALANAVANAYLRQNVERRSAEAAQTLAFLKTQLPGIKAKVEAAEGALNGYRLRNSSIDLDKETDFVLTESADIERKRNEVLQKRAELLLTLTAVHPSVKALDIQSARLSEQSERVQQAIAKMPETQQELLSLRREVEVNTSLYTTMLNNMQQLEVAEAGTLGNVRIINEASVPGGPFKPQPLFAIVAGVIAGLAIGLMVLILMQLMDQAEHDPAAIERFAGVPAYATVPYSPAQQKMIRLRDKSGGEGQLLVVTSPHDPAAESIRSLRTTLHFSVFESGRKSIMFTGPTPGIGKSFVTANLAAVLAQVPMKVILIDADLRRGTIHNYYGLDRGKGLSNYVLGAGIEEVLQPTSVSGLSIISTGEVPPNPSELLMSPRFIQLIAEAEAQADMVLVDTGPILAVTDAGIIGRVVGGTLLVFKAAQHSGREITESVKRLAQVGVRVNGLVINQVGRSRGYYGYYAYGKYGYYYSYGYKSNEK